MGEHTEFVNGYFVEAAQSMRANFAIEEANQGYMAMQATPSGFAPTAFALGNQQRQSANNFNVEVLYNMDNTSNLQQWDLRFLAQLEELHDYYALLYRCGYPVTFSDFRLAAGLTAIKWDGFGNITLPGGQSFEVHYGQPEGV